MILYTNMWQYCQNVRAIIWFDGIVLTLHGKRSISIGFTCMKIIVVKDNYTSYILYIGRADVIHELKAHFSTSCVL